MAIYTCFDEHVKLSCVAESAAPLHVACGVRTAGVEGACSGSYWHSLTATVCGRLVNQVLGHFRDRFIREVDASTIVFGLKHKGIIPDGVLVAVNKETSATLRNQILYAHLEKTSTKDSLITVCELIIAVPGNPRMRALGEDMKSKLPCK